MCPLGNNSVCTRHAVPSCFKAGQDHRKVNATCVELLSSEHYFWELNEDVTWEEKQQAEILLLGSCFL